MLTNHQHRVPQTIVPHKDLTFLTNAHLIFSKTRGHLLCFVWWAQCDALPCLCLLSLVWTYNKPPPSTFMNITITGSNSLGANNDGCSSLPLLVIVGPSIIICVHNVLNESYICAKCEMYTHIYRNKYKLKITRNSRKGQDDVAARQEVFRCFSKIH